MKTGKRRRIWMMLIALAAVAAVIGVPLLKPSSDFDPKLFRTVPIDRGTITKTITASGTINPVNVVNIGSQVSGNIQEILVDFNDKVEKNQILAQIDPTVLKSQLDDSKSRLQKVRAQQVLARANAERNRTLYKERFIAKIELEQSETSLIAANADVASAESEVRRNESNLEYATIRSPVAGTVISREVSMGQTVAASFQTPTLFKIAEDLTRMQIEANVTEADIGEIKTGLPVKFTVDAYPDQEFDGVVQQLRLNPANTSNVVTYMVVISVDNSSLKLLPGMTAYISIMLESRKDVLRVDNAALRFSPDMRQMAAWNVQENAQKTSPMQVKLYLLRADRIEQVWVTRELNTLTKTQISGDSIKEGDMAIADYLGPGSVSEGSAMQMPRLRMGR